GDVPACPPSAVSSARVVVRPSDAPYIAAASPAGPPPMTSRSHTSEGPPSSGGGAESPSASSSARLLGLRSSSPPGTTTIGRSANGTLSRWRSASAAGSPSSSSHLKDNRLRDRTSSNLRVSMSKRDPTSVRPEPRRLSIMLNDPGLACEQNDQVICLIAVAEEHIADCHGLFGPIAMEDLELSPAQDRPVARLLRSSLRDGGAISHCDQHRNARSKSP